MQSGLFKSEWEKMNDLTDNVASRMTAARRNAEALMKPTTTPEVRLKLQQEARARSNGCQNRASS